MFYNKNIYLETWFRLWWLRKLILYVLFYIFYPIPVHPPQLVGLCLHHILINNHFTSQNTNIDLGLENFKCSIFNTFLYWCPNWNKGHIRQLSSWTGLSSILLSKFSWKVKHRPNNNKALVKELGSVMRCHLVHLAVIHFGWQSAISINLRGNSIFTCSHKWFQTDFNLILPGS